VVPSCFDALSGMLIEQEGFALTFMSGFAASAARIGAPDLGLMSYGEVVDHARDTCEAIRIPLIADGDTGYGNAMNVRRTVLGFARAGCAAVLIEDQMAPKLRPHPRQGGGRARGGLRPDQGRGRHARRAGHLDPRPHRRAL